MPVEDIAKQLGIKPRRVYYLLSRAKDIIKKYTP